MVEFVLTQSTNMGDANVMDRIDQVCSAIAVCAGAATCYYCGVLGLGS